MTSVAAVSAPAPDALGALFARYDREPDGPAKDRLAARIDAMAHQKHATVSRLYWHTDLTSARAAARAQQRPILHLRLLGRLDEELSCANSRLFRATLYANRDLSTFLRERFILYWSSERPVPRVTIDYGDGRVLERTVTGNSAHYILDEDGGVLDVLPGLYAPTAFRRELERSLALAALVRGLSPEDRTGVIVDEHQRHVTAAERDWVRIAPLVPGVRGRLMPASSQVPVVAAQLVTVTKAVRELTDLRAIAREPVPEMLAEDHSGAWWTVGQMLYGIGTPNEPAGPPFHVLDEASRALVVRLHNAGSAELRSTDEELRRMMARLEQTIIADSAINRLHVRPQISREIVRRGGQIEFATLNAWIYAQVFRTPREDPWLGLVRRDVFTGLAGDGVVVRRGPQP
jgi:hypothetical protein